MVSTIISTIIIVVCVAFKSRAQDTGEPFLITVMDIRDVMEVMEVSKEKAKETLHRVPQLAQDRAEIAIELLLKEAEDPDWEHL